MIWFSVLLQQMNSLNRMPGYSTYSTKRAKARKLIPFNCLLGLHDKDTTENYISVNNIPINRSTCKNCRDYILPEEFLKREKLSSQSSVVVLQSEPYTHISYLTKTLYSTATRPPERVNESDLVQYPQMLITSGVKAISVQRLVDGEIFSIGDIVRMEGECSNWQICSFGNGEEGQLMDYCTVQFTHTTCYVISIGLLTKIK